MINFDDELFEKIYGYSVNFDSSNFSSLGYTKEPNERELTILGLCYGEVRNQYPDWNLKDRKARLKLNESHGFRHSL